ncbi:hypothetical protein [Rehaibacterium terrae]|jgi:anti-sigma-K factor RskA|uniref:Anti-sigma-K factor RskA n=1 Tax=Rehaibacterium terrae TaxID=1341696 RepID=A0A7W7V7J2_9GAMM|nr:hypothetical protein [Rehaibacterium terrae]MBB5014680.1 anti-sigma-K factor RskA [Rehaibacterium terrae]
MTTPLSPQRFADLLAAHGADPRRWPQAERAAALALLAASPEARRQQHEAARLDALLDAWQPPAPSPDLRLRLLHAMPLPQRAESLLHRLWRELGGWRLAAPALAGALALGIAIGVLLPAMEAGDDLLAEWLSLAQLDDPYEEYTP